MLIIIEGIVSLIRVFILRGSGIDSVVAGSARASLELGGSEKGQSLIFAHWSLAITASISGFEKQTTALRGSRS